MGPSGGESSAEVMLSHLSPHKEYFLRIVLAKKINCFKSTIYVLNLSFMTIDTVSNS